MKNALTKLSLAASLISWASAASAQTIRAPSASTIYQEGNQLRARANFDSGTPKGLNSIPVTLIYGVGPSLTTAITVPYQNLQETGIGDIALTGKYRFYFDTGPEQFLQWAAFSTVKLPTGSTSKGLGSGSTDATFGVARNKVQNLRWFYNGSLTYTLKTEGTGGLNKGDVFGYNLATAFRPYVPPYPPTWRKPDVWGVFEVLGSVAGRNRIGGVSQAGTGGHTIFFAPGVQLLPRKNLILEASLQIPAYEDLNGGKKAPDRKFLTGFRLLF